MGMTEPAPKPRWYRLTPDRCVIGLLVVECLLWLSERFQWLTWHKGYAVLSAVAVVGVAMLVMLFWFAVSLLFRWRFQFSIRALLVLVVAVAVSCSWLAVEIRAAKKQWAAVAAIELLGASVDYDWQVDVNGKALRNAQPPKPEWLRDLPGDDFFSHVQAAHHHPWFTDVGLEHLEGLTQLQQLYLYGTQVTDAGLKHLKGLTQLQQLYLYGTKVTDEGVKNLQQALPNCKIAR